MRRDGSVTWPNSIRPGGVAQEGLLIPVSSSELSVDGGWRGTNCWKWVRHVEERSVKNAVRADDFKEGAQVCNTSQSCHKFDLSHTHACMCENCYQVRNTHKTEKNVRATRCSVISMMHWDPTWEIGSGSIF